MAEPTTPTSAPVPGNSPIKPPSSKTNKTVLTMVLVIAGVLVMLSLLGIILAVTLGRKAVDKTGDSLKDASQLAQDIQQYPDAYKEAGLPEYPGAEVTHLGRKNAKPTEASIVLVITSHDPVATMAAYYDKELSARGWNLKPDSTTETSELVSKTYSKETQEYSILVQRSTESNNATAATITWEQSR